MKKLRVAVIFGGRSGEHEVSLVSARNIINALDPNKYSPLPVGITKTGVWLTGSRALKFLTHGRTDSLAPLAHLPSPGHPSFHIVRSDSLRKVPCDIAFPVLHGPYGEDGTIQGLFEMIGMPYVGCGVSASAVCMDKFLTKMILQAAGIPIVPFIRIQKDQFRETPTSVVEEIARKFRFPCFVKPANLGSSVGITKVKKLSALAKALKLAFCFDTSVLVEQGINAREIECAILGNEKPQASIAGEIIPCNEFYDYEAKYVDNRSELLIPAPLKKNQLTRVQKLAIAAYRVLGCEGLARVDFLLDKRSDKLYLNELNTIPGFTKISMYPQLWNASGIGYTQLLDRLIHLGLNRHKQRQKLQMSPKLAREWHRY